MNLQPPIWAPNLRIDQSQFVSQAITTDHQNAPPPKPPQNRWRMPDERMELMCDYLTRADKEKQTQLEQTHNRLHCTQHPPLPSHQMEYLVTLLVRVMKSRGQLYSKNINVTRPDWAAIRHAFNVQFGENTKLSVLECAMQKERYKYMIALFRERYKMAKEQQPELGEEYWHWMEV